MRKKQSSLTAAGIALMRAVESEKPAEERICYDPYARKLIPAWMYHVFGFFIKTGYAERRGPSVTGFLAARDRYIDDVLQQSLDDGLQQLVILGAGYDSRAYRFKLEGVKTFEVDHPATQADKLEKLLKILGKLPEHVEYVPIDFNIQILAERLLDSGYNRALKTLFIWQGVTMYLTADAVDATLAFVAQYSGPDSAITFDYLYREVLDGIRQQNEVANMRRYRFMTGEGLTFGIPQGRIEPFLEERGFQNVRDVNSDYLKTTYFIGKNAGELLSMAMGL